MVADVSQNVVHTRAAVAPGPEPTPYDFRRPMTLSREQSRALAAAFETFARQWATQLTAKVRIRTRVGFESVCVQSYGAYTADLSTLTTMTLCGFADLESRGVLQFPVEAALVCIGHVLGSSPEMAADGSRELTRIEQALIRPLAAETFEDLHYSLGDLLAAEPTLQTMRFNAQFAQAAPPQEEMVVAAFTVDFGERSYPATLALPAAALLPALGAPTSTPAADLPALLGSALQSVPVDVSVRLAPQPVTPGRILDLTVGDVLVFPHPQSRPLEVVVDDRTLAHAAVGSSGSRLAGVITSTEENPR